MNDGVIGKLLVLVGRGNLVQAVACIGVAWMSSVDENIWMMLTVEQLEIGEKALTVSVCVQCMGVKTQLIAERVGLRRDPRVRRHRVDKKEIPRC